MQQNDFEQVDLNTFFDTQSLAADQNEKAEMLTTQQKQLIQEVMPLIKQIDPEKANSFQQRLLQCFRRFWNDTNLLAEPELQPL